MTIFYSAVPYLAHESTKRPNLGNGVGTEVRNEAHRENAREPVPQPFQFDDLLFKACEENYHF